MLCLASLKKSSKMPEPTNNRNKFLDFRQSHAIVIGINDYPIIGSPLETAVNDAKKIALRLKNQQNFDNVLLMCNPARAEIVALLDWLANPKREAFIDIPEVSANEKNGFIPKSNLGWPEFPVGGNERHAKQVTPWHIEPDKDSIVFYYAGHGVPGLKEGGPSGYIVPSDGSNSISENRSFIAMDQLYTAFKKLNCHHTLLILDCCFAGKFRFSRSSRFESTTVPPPLYRQRFNNFKNSRAWQVLVSSSADQVANDSASWFGIRTNSPFADTLFKALDGAADIPLNGKKRGDGAITASELRLYVRQEVDHIITQGSKQPQHPDLFAMEDHNGGDFLFLNSNFDLNKLLDRPIQNPYRGLLPYEPEAKAWFFGREEETDEVYKQLRKFPIAIISGPSAVGKSSLVKAGLFP